MCYEKSVTSISDKVTSTAKFYCGLLPTFRTEGNAEFELKVNKNTDVIFPIQLWELLNSIHSAHEGP